MKAQAREGQRKKRRAGASHQAAQGTRGKLNKHGRHKKQHRSLTKQNTAEDKIHRKTQKTGTQLKTRRPRRTVLRKSSERVERRGEPTKRPTARES